MKNEIQKIKEILSRPERKRKKKKFKVPSFEKMFTTEQPYKYILPKTKTPKQRNFGETEKIPYPSARVFSLREREQLLKWILKE